MGEIIRFPGVEPEGEEKPEKKRAAPRKKKDRLAPEKGGISEDIKIAVGLKCFVIRIHLGRTRPSKQSTEADAYRALASASDEDLCQQAMTVDVADIGQHPAFYRALLAQLEHRGLTGKSSTR